MEPFRKEFDTAMLIGTAGSIFLTGASTFQTIFFFTRQAKDPRGHKILVSLFFLAGFLESVFILHAAYYFLVYHKRTQLVGLPWTYQIQIIVLTFLASASKSIYGLRIWKLTPKIFYRRLIIYLLFISVLVEQGFGGYVGARMFSVKYLYQFPFIDFKWANKVALGLASVNDIFVAVYLVYGLVKSHPDLQWTDSSFTMLTAYILNSGVIPGIFTTITLSLYSSTGVATTDVAFLIILPQLYVNCFIAMVNARGYFNTTTTAHHRRSTTRVSLSMQESMAFLSFASVQGRSEHEDRTINDIGFPIFSRSRDHDASSKEPALPLEVKVQTKRVHHLNYRYNV